MLEENPEAVARVAKTFGQNGELTLNLFSSFPRDFNLSEPLFVIIDSLAVPLFCDRFQRRGQSGAVVIFGDIDTERRASELIGQTLYRANPSAPADEDNDEADDGLIYLEDLVGYSVRLVGITPETTATPPVKKAGTGTKKDTGVSPEPATEDRIEEFIDGENPLFRVTIDGNEVFIPAVEEFIADIDSDNGSIEFDLPEGLLELYMK